uniref:Protein FAM49B-like n=1 Tax=Ciona intestinalis TaxID=7719 RepID=F6PYR8_CIOIN|nr:protein FAM49B-like [Ciona intestinalis]|eukprot:XP_002126684.1 protein FAM49B-like [Ciona intestinalis]
MGNLLKVLQCKEEAFEDFFLDFENARPSEEEKEVYDQVSHVLSFAPGIITELKSYKGAGDEIRVAISNPSSQEKQADTWHAIIPLVKQLKEFFEFSKHLQKCIQELLRALTCHPLSPLQHLESKQALAKQFAEILHFTLKFDDLKMNNPAIQNDFSYFRRTMQRRGMNSATPGIDYEEGRCISTEMANEMSLFYAEATPMLRTLSDATTRFVQDNDDVETDRTLEVLSTMANICKAMLENPDDQRFQMGADSVSFCVRVMVGVIILYDHVHKDGAFAKGSKIDIKGSIRVVKEQNAKVKVKTLLNALRYTTKHLNDEATPKAIQKMLEC